MLHSAQGPSPLATERTEGNGRPGRHRPRELFPFSPLGRWGDGTGAARRIFLILSILPSCLLLQFRSCCSGPATMAFQ